MWYKYNGAHVVFQPAKMSAQRLKDEFVNCWKGFYEMNQSRNLAQMEPSVWCGDELKVSKRLEVRGVGSEAARHRNRHSFPARLLPKGGLGFPKKGVDGIAQGTKLDLSAFVSKICAEVKGFDPASRMSESELKTYTDPFIRMSICAARAAIEDSGVDLGSYSGKIGYVLATCNAGPEFGEKSSTARNTGECRFQQERIDAIRVLRPPKGPSFGCRFRR